MHKNKNFHLAKSLGLFIMRARQEQQMTVVMLAAKSNLSESQVWRIATGNVAMKISSYKSINNVLGLLGQDML